MNSRDIFVNNQFILDEHFNEQRRALYAKRITPQEVNETLASRLADEFWLEINEYPIPEFLSSEEKRNIFLHFLPLVLQKRKEKPPFQYYKKYDVKGLKEEILNLEENYWDMGFKRLQRQTEQIHKHTQIIGNTLFSLDYNGNGVINVIKNDLIPSNIQYMTDEIVSDLERQFDGKVLISGYTRLNVGNKINPHIDDLYYFKIVRRFQIAILTNSKVFFNIDDQIKVFDEGDCYEVNNLIKHSILNEGETDRINLLVDILPNQKIKSYNIHY